jgi:hypothetical protein
MSKSPIVLAKRLISNVARSISGIAFGCRQKAVMTTAAERSASAAITTTAG